MTEPSAADAFEALVGSTFRVVDEWAVADDPGPTDEAGDPEEGGRHESVAAEPGPPVALTLTRVERLGHPGPFEQFRVLFSGPRDTPLDQGTFVLDPAPGGLEALLLVPSAERDDERVYCASLSVRRPPTEGVGT